jgi:hypothetical protein
MKDKESKAEVHNLKASLGQESKYTILLQRDMIWFGFPVLSFMHSMDDSLRC